MPSLETPPNSAPPTPPSQGADERYGDLEEHELIHLLDALDDERAKARFRESVYISIIIWLAIGWFVLYGPQVIFHQPRLINPADVLKERDKQLTYLDMPKDIGKQLPKKPTNVISDKDRVQQTKKPTMDKKTLEQLQAMRKAGAPGANCTAYAPASRATSRTQQAQQQPQPPLRSRCLSILLSNRRWWRLLARLRQSRTSATRVCLPAMRFVRQPRQAAQNRGQGGDYGANIPVEHQGMNTGVDVLSDTMGVDFNPYLRRILREIYNTWLPLIPEEARPPLNKAGRDADSLLHSSGRPHRRDASGWLDTGPGAGPCGLGLDHGGRAVSAAAEGVPRTEPRAAHPLPRQQEAGVAWPMLMAVSLP